MARITGLGGVFYKSPDVERTRRWYADMLGLQGEWGIMLPASADTPEAYSLISPFKADTDYLDPSALPFMINLRVNDLEGLLARLEAKGIEILGRQDEEYGSFAWILDCDGIKLELWQQRGPVPTA